MSGWLRFFISIPFGALYGWAGALLWGWFIVPFGAPPLTFWHAWGLLLVACLCRVFSTGLRDLPDDGVSHLEAKAWGLMVLKAVTICVLVGVGALVHGAMV